VSEAVLVLLAVVVLLQAFVVFVAAYALIVITLQIRAERQVLERLFRRDGDQ
jgi:hypothetical protein